MDYRIWIGTILIENIQKYTEISKYINIQKYPEISSISKYPKIYRNIQNIKISKNIQKYPVYPMHPSLAEPQLPGKPDVHWGHSGWPWRPSVDLVYQKGRVSRGIKTAKNKTNKQTNDTQVCIGREWSKYWSEFKKKDFVKIYQHSRPKTCLFTFLLWNGGGCAGVMWHQHRASGLLGMDVHQVPSKGTYPCHTITITITAGDGCPRKKLESEDDCLHRVWKCVLEKYPKFYWIIFQGASLNSLDYYCFLRSPSWYYVRFWFFMKELTQVWVCPLPSYHNLSHIQYISYIQIFFKRLDFLSVYPLSAIWPSGLH